MDLLCILILTEWPYVDGVLWGPVVVSLLPEPGTPWVSTVRAVCALLLLLGVFVRVIVWWQTLHNGSCFTGALLLAKFAFQVCSLWNWLGGTMVWSEKASIRGIWSLLGETSM